MDSISQHQCFLLAAVFASRREKDLLADLLACFVEQPDLYNAVAALWPELDDPAHLEFLFDVKPRDDVDIGSLLVQLMDSDDKLIPIVEMEHSVLQERCRATKEYVDSRINDIPECNGFDFRSFEAQWLRRRMILCNRFTPLEATSYRPLWKVVKSDVDFNRWIDGIVQPVEHINKRLGKALTIEAFETMEPLNVFELILKTKPEFPSTVIHREVIPYLKNSNLYGLFLDNVFTEAFFPLNSTSNIRNFSYLYAELYKVSPDSETNSCVQAHAAQIIFDNSSDLLKYSSLFEVRELLSKIDDDVKVGTSEIKVSLLKHFTKCMETVFKNYSLKEIYSISQEEAFGQLAHFSAIVREQVLSHRGNGEIIETVSQLMDVSGSKDDRVFKNLTLDQKTSVFIETVLEMGKFELLEDFLTKFDSNVDEEVLVKHFWHFYNKASNGLRSRPEMRNAKRTLDLLLKTDEAKYSHLNALLDVANDLSTYSLNLGKGIPFKPSDVLTFKTRIFDLISLLLELNPSLYKNMNSTLGIVENLQIGLQLMKRGDKTSDETRATVLALHIDHSLANLDFKFALDGTKKLLKINSISSFWPTIFQVGKFIDPTWTDGEAPIDILVAQLHILGDLLRFCPVEEVEAIVSQWSAVELEVITRDPTLASFPAEESEERASFPNAHIFT